MNKGFLTILLLGACILAHGQSNSPAKPTIDDLMRWQHEAITWGAATNGLQLGVARVGGTSNTTTDKYSFIVYLCNTNQTPYVGLKMCPEGYRLNLSLIDSGGTRIAKSSIGDGKCKLLSALTKSQMRQENYSQKHVLVLTKMMSFQYDKFDLLDCFKIQASGDYTLEVHANLYKLKYPDLESVTVPDILIKISILKADLDRYSSLKDNSQ